MGPMPHDSIELLSPAGCFPSLHAAIAQGADAIYFGLAHLNMRARARRSFLRRDLPEIVHICRSGGVRCYLALNTLLYEHDLRLCQKLLESAAEAGIDAVILSDLAAMQMAHALELEIHLSTQLSISNSEAVRFYAPYCDRIVLARELNLSMIRAIHQRIVADNLCGRSGQLVKIEAFAHGALCIAISGRCGMSLYSSGASANRGACEQNCRKEYLVKDVNTGQEMIVDNNLVLSPNDILTLDFLDQMVDCGVQAFKIEGRGRSPEYVAAVTSVYRKALDAIRAGTYTQALVNELMPVLKKVYNRGFSSGHYLGRQQGWSRTADSQATHRKVYVGTIINYYERAGVVLSKATAADLAVGDEYLVIGKTTGVVGGRVEQLLLCEGDAMHGSQTAPQGSTFTLPHQGKVRRGDKLYKMQPTGASQL
jgi:U32 family peptidase